MASGGAFFCHLLAFEIYDSCNLLWQNCVSSCLIKFYNVKLMSLFLSFFGTSCFVYECPCSEHLCQLENAASSYITYITEL